MDEWVVEMWRKGRMGRHEGRGWIGGGGVEVC
jgi:hypothetical protein